MSAHEGAKATSAGEGLARAVGTLGVSERTKDDPPPETPASTEAGAAADAVPALCGVPKKEGDAGGSDEETPRGESQRQMRQRDRQEKRSRGDAAIHMSCLGGHTGVLKALVDANANLDSRSNRDGGTPIMRAITGSADNNVAVDKSLACVQMLIEMGANLNVTDFSGNTALHCAFVNHQKEIADLIIDNGGGPCKNDAGNRLGTCRRCALNLTMRAKAKKKQERQTPVSREGTVAEDTKKVLQEEFGDGDFASLLASMKGGGASQSPVEGASPAGSPNKRKKKKKKKQKNKNRDLTDDQEATELPSSAEPMRSSTECWEIDETSDPGPTEHLVVISDDDLDIDDLHDLPPLIVPRGTSAAAVLGIALHADSKQPGACAGEDVGRHGVLTVQAAVVQSSIKESSCGDGDETSVPAGWLSRELFSRSPITITDETDEDLLCGEGTTEDPD
eukprot:m.14271 g.14271  ORF g.14271 m.14271 type:complete len:449 (-) comp4768_c0_seq1:1999-3345(-)